MTNPRSSLMLAALCWCVLLGCSKKETPSAQPTPEQAAQIEADYLPPPEGVAQPGSAAASPRPATPVRPAAAQRVARPGQERLNGAVHAVPLAPAGIKLVIDPADRTVKAVKT